MKGSPINPVSCYDYNFREGKSAGKAREKIKKGAGL
jgi:hypothetical protein